MKVIDTKSFKAIKSSKFNSIFNKSTGEFFRWGETKQDDPEFCQFGPEILDLELSTICHQNCKVCYKGNTSSGKNMSFEDYKIILSKMPPTLHQVAFGIGSIDSHPELFKILAYTREKGVVPNITINGFRMNDDYYKQLVLLCGAVSVSNYNKDVCYGAVEKLNYWKNELSNSTLKQVNIHQILSADTLEKCYEVINDSKKDQRLKDLNAVVFLTLKPKGPKNTFNQLKNKEEYKKLIDVALSESRIGFDSCGCDAFLEAIENHPKYKIMEMYSESCESSLFSSYIDVEGKFYPCSFAQGTIGWEDGLDVLHCEDYLKDIWLHSKTEEFRDKLLNTAKCNKNNCRICPIYNLKME